MINSRWMTEEQQALHEMAHRFALDKGTPHLERWREQQYIDPEFWLAAGELGLLGCSIPEECGGPGGTPADDFVVLDAFVKAGISAGPFQINNVIAPHYLVNYGTPEQQQAWLPDIVAGRAISALAMTEPDAGSDVQAIRTRAVRDGDDYVLNGSKIFITNGARADVIVVAASTDPSARGKGLSLFVVDTATPGFEVGRALHKIGMHESDTAELSFTDVRVPASNRLGEEGDGFPMLMGQLPLERMLVAAASVAAIEYAVELGVTQVNERQAFGKPLIAQQHLRFEVAEAMTLAKVARAFLDDCVEKLLAGELDDTTAAMAKWWLTDQENLITDQVLQLFGGYGYMAEYPIAHLFTASRVQRIYAGTNEIMKEIIGRTAMR